jgi:hypothetical protein
MQDRDLPEGRGLAGSGNQKEQRALDAALQAPHQSPRVIGREPEDLD